MPQSELSKSDAPALKERSAWTSVRRLEFWLLWPTLLYAVLGFFVAPLLVKSQVIQQLNDNFGLQAQLVDIDINPFMLSLTAEGFDLADQQGKHLVAVDGLYVNYQISSLFLNAYVMKELRVSGADINFVRLDSNDSNFSLAFETETDSQIEQIEPAAQELPRIRIDHLKLEHGKLDFTDETPETAFQTTIDPVNLTINDLNTTPGFSGTQSVEIITDNGGSLQWDGNLQLQPFESSGHAKLAGTHLKLVRRYLQDQVKFTLSDAETEIDFNYSVVTDPDNQIALDVDSLNLRIRDLALGDPASDQKYLTIPQVELNNGSFKWPRQEVNAEKISISTPAIHAVRAPDGRIDLADLFQAGDDSAGTTAPANDTQPWTIGVGSFVISGMDITFQDQVPAQSASLAVNELDFTLSEFSNIAGEKAAMTLAFALGSGGRVSAEGKIGLAPGFELQSTIDISGLLLHSAQPYVSDFARIDIKSGKLDLSGNLSSSVDNDLGFDGRISVTELELTDTDRGERFAGWQSLDIDRLSLDSGNESLEISELKLVEPYGRVDIAADQSTNVGRIFSAAETDPVTSEPAADPETENSYEVTIGRIVIENGSANFSDASLPLTFATQIQKLSGEVSTFVSGSSEPALVSLEGQIDEYGLARIEGAIDLIAPTEKTDITISFNNLELESLNPYTIAFAGRKIDEGKLDLKLEYLLAGRKLKGENNIVIKDITLGEKVDHPGAMDLPLDLAIGLLKNASGEIDIDLPVSGNLDDPEFSYGGIVFKALAGLLVKAVASPFRLLGRLVGSDSEDFDRVSFLPGESTLTPPELEKVHLLAEALLMRPQLNAQVGGVIDPVVDKHALQLAKLDALLAEQMVSDASDTGEDMLLTKTRSIIEKLYSQIPNHEALPHLQQKFTAASDTEAGQTKFDELAYVAEMKDQLLSVQTVTGAELKLLASGRADAIITAISAHKPGLSERISIVETRQVKAGDDDWIATKLELAASSAN